MKNKPITAADAMAHIAQYEIPYASCDIETGEGNGVTSNRVRMSYKVSAEQSDWCGCWIVRKVQIGKAGTISETLYLGTDVDKAVLAFNEQL